jgi:hypothetical protein
LKAAGATFLMTPQKIFLTTVEKQQKLTVKNGNALKPKW